MKVNKFEEFLKLKNKYEKKRKEIMSLISDYYNINDDFRIRHLGGEVGKRINVVSLSKSDDTDFETGEYFYWVEYYFSGINYDKITQSEYDDIMKFVDNPDLYKSKTKYNL